MEAICSSETLVDIQQTTCDYFPEDDTLHCSYFFPEGSSMGRWGNNFIVFHKSENVSITQITGGEVGEMFL
jgi:hypothetical protein